MTVETFTKYLARLLYQANEEGRNRVAQQGLGQFRPKGKTGRNRRYCYQMMTNWLIGTVVTVLAFGRPECRYLPLGG